MKKLFFLAVFFGFFSKIQGQQLSSSIYGGALNGIQITATLGSFDISTNVDIGKNFGISLIYFFPKNDKFDIYLFYSVGPEGAYKSFGLEYSWELKNSWVIFFTDFSKYPNCGLIFDLPFKNK